MLPVSLSAHSFLRLPATHFGMSPPAPRFRKQAAGLACECLCSRQARTASVWLAVLRANVWPVARMRRPLSVAAAAEGLRRAVHPGVGRRVRRHQRSRTEDEKGGDDSLDRRHGLMLLFCGAFPGKAGDRTPRRLSLK